MGVGLPQPQLNPIFKGLTPKQGFWTSKEFLPKVAKASKPGMGKEGACGSACSLPKLSGNVVVLGAGDTAFDCATSALRCGASKVYVAFRKGIQGMRAVPEEVEVAVEEQVELQPFLQVQSVVTDDGTGKIKMVEFARSYEGRDGAWNVDTEQSSVISADHGTLHCYVRCYVTYGTMVRR